MFVCVDDETADEAGVTIEHVLVFFTGASSVPILGWPHEPELFFDPVSMFPTASTCAIQLTLPSKYEISNVSCCKVFLITAVLGNVRCLLLLVNSFGLFQFCFWYWQLVSVQLTQEEYLSFF